MTTTRFLNAFLLFIFCSCSQTPVKHKVNPDAIALNQKAMELVPFLDNPDSSRKALSLLDEATNIDSNYFLGYNNKLMFLYQLKQLDRVITTINKLIELKPSAHDLYLTGGILYEQLGDTISSKKYFQKSLSICNKVLDTMTVNNRNYVMFSMNKAVNLIMLGDEVKGNDLLNQLYAREADELDRELLEPIMNKSKKELLSLMTITNYSR